MSSCCVWDITIASEKNSLEFVKKYFNAFAKKWVFQGECGGTTGFNHWQCRVSLKVKKTLVLFQAHMREAGFEGYINISPTSNENAKNTFYVMKEETRTSGPFSSDDEEVYIPRQIREMGPLYNWQQHVVDNANIWDTRSVNLVINPGGGVGKSCLKGYMRAMRIGRPIPFVNDYKDLCRMVMDLPTSRCYLIDIPRAIRKEHLFQLFAGIESLKDGYAYDDRYTFKEKYFDCPNIWVFSNKLPDITLLSRDRWKLWVINEEYGIEPFDPEATFQYTPPADLGRCAGILPDPYNSFKPLEFVEFQPSAAEPAAPLTLREKELKQFI